MTRAGPAGVLISGKIHPGGNGGLCDWRFDLVLPAPATPTRPDLRSQGERHLALGIEQHRRGRAASAERLPDGKVRVERDGRSQAHGPISFRVAAGDNEQLRCPLGRVCLQGLDLVQNPLAVTASGAPEQHERRRPAEGGEINWFSGQVESFTVGAGSPISGFRAVAPLFGAAGLGILPLARANTAGAPRAIGDAILPSASISTAEGVPVAPKARPVANPWSRTTVDFNSIRRFCAISPFETTSSFGASSGGFSSQALRSGSIRLQNPHPGFQNSTRVGAPRKVVRSTGSPVRSGSTIGGAGSPTFVFGAWAPLFFCASARLFEAFGDDAARLRSSSSTLGAPRTTGEAILPSASTSTADGTPGTPKARRACITAEHHRRAETHLPVRLCGSARDNQQFRRACRRISLPRLELGQHRPAASLTRIPEQHEHRRALEGGQVDREHPLDRPASLAAPDRRP